MKKPTRHYAFTLIELFGVIAIISLLAAIVFPVFASAREKAKQTTCASNGKQIADAILQYSSDCDETLPLANSVNIPTNTGWQFAIEPYVKAHADNGSNSSGDVVANAGLSVYVCPDWDTTWNGQDSGADVISSYAANRVLMPLNALFYSTTPTSYFNTLVAGNYYAAPSSIAKIDYPSQQVLFAEAEGVREAGREARCAAPETILA